MTSQCSKDRASLNIFLITSCYQNNPNSVHEKGAFEGLGASTANKTNAVAFAANGMTLELDTLVKRHIQHVLNLTEGKIHGPGGAGEVLGMNPDTLRYKMKKFGIPFRKKRKTK